MPDSVVNAAPLGVCPYCGSANLTQRTLRRPGQYVETCGDCGRYSVRATRARGQYPVSDPTDPDSSPGTSGRV